MQMHYFFYLDVLEEDDRLQSLLDEILRSDQYIAGRYFDFYYSQSLTTETTLSSGEQVFLRLFANLYQAIEYIPKKFTDINKTPLLLLLDEAEVGFHPEWQKSFIKILTSFLDCLNVPKDILFQVVITTHSPILLSDFPKVCTNFLKRNNDGSVINLRNAHRPTFGSNIFELYRDSFFLEKGMIGEFANDKIKKLRKEILSITDIGDAIYQQYRKRIDLIGDIFIRNGLYSLLDEKMSESALAYYERKVEELKRKNHHE